jgi:uncharacterized protein YebE (UPF0316 family)
MPTQVVLTCLLIVLARITDVSLGTLRTVSVIHGHRTVAFVLGFFEVLVWVLIVAKVVTSLHEPIYAVAYAFGFASGNYVGITIEQLIAHGRQIVRIFTRRADMSARLREAGYRVTEFDGRGREGPVQMLFVVTSRRDAPRVVKRAREIDHDCFYVLDDIRSVSAAGLFPPPHPTGWRNIFKKK